MGNQLVSKWEEYKGMTVGDLKKLIDILPDDTLVCVPDFSYGKRDGERPASKAAFTYTLSRVIIE